MLILESPTGIPSSLPSLVPSVTPTSIPSESPTNAHSHVPSSIPSELPTSIHSHVPSSSPSVTPTLIPSSPPTGIPSLFPSFLPSGTPTIIPSESPTSIPSSSPSLVPSVTPTSIPSESPTTTPSSLPTSIPSHTPTSTPSGSPTELCSPDENGLFGDTENKLAAQIVYRYQVETDPNIDVNITEIIPKIEEEISDALLSVLFEACRNRRLYLQEQRSLREGRRLEIVALSSRPPDRVQNKDCLVASDDQYDCAPVEGAMTIYTDKVQSDETDAVLESIKDLMEKNKLIHVDESIKKITFIEIEPSVSISSGPNAVLEAAVSRNSSRSLLLPITIGCVLSVVLVTIFAGLRHRHVSQQDKLFVELEESTCDGSVQLSPSKSKNDESFERYTREILGMDPPEDTNDEMLESNHIEIFKMDPSEDRIELGFGTSPREHQRFLPSNIIVPRATETENESDTELMFDPKRYAYFKGRQPLF
uniref:SEA domain-containing protein n=1 Tax=Ditylum brightwellii TaxID=49249 RepID=A0A6V2MD16_9STRA